MNSAIEKLGRLDPRNWNLRRRKSHPAVLTGYTGSNFFRRNRTSVFIAFALFSAIYGIAAVIFIPYLLLQLVIPIIILALLTLWLLPDTEHAPTRILEFSIFAFIIGLLAWPDYIALALSGLPWITVIRLVAVPLALAMLLCCALSKEFRDRMAEILSATPVTWKLLCAFVFISFLSMFFSSFIFQSINKFFVAQVYWTLVFFVSVYVFVKPGRVTWLAYVLFALALFVSLIGVLEWEMQQVPWMNRIPSWLKIDEDMVAHIMTGSRRAATGIYRVQSKFTTPLGLAEFLSFASPFMVHLLMTHKKWFVRLAAALMLPFICYTIIRTDSRLGMVGFFLTFLFYLAAWSVMRWKHDRDSLFGPAFTLAYPIIFISFIIATFVVGRLRALVWGTGAQSFSTTAREDQIAAGIPMILEQPWGHGIGLGAATLGFTDLAGMLTIDSYYLLLGLEFGLIGFLVYMGIFLVQLYYGATSLLKVRSGEVLYAIPLCIALTNFVVIKSIFAQTENHPLVFAMLGALTALIYRMKQGEGQEILSK